MRLIRSVLALALILLAVGAVFVFFKKTSAGRSLPSAVAKLQLGADIAQAFIAPTVEPDYLPFRDYSVPDPVIQAGAAFLIDNRTGRVLFDHNSEEQLPIASITKLMTAVIVVERLDVKKNYVVPKQAVNVDGDGADLTAGEEISGVDLFQSMLVPSSNDAATVFAYTASKQFDFVEAMNSKAAEIGMRNTHFNNSTGLDDPKSYSTARDIVILASYASKYKVITDALKIQKTTVFSVDGTKTHQLLNTNQLLDTISNINIAKTGNTQIAGGTMVMSVKINEKDSVTAVVLGSKDRFAEITRLIKFARQAHTWI